VPTEGNVEACPSDTREHTNVEPGSQVSCLDEAGIDHRAESFACGKVSDASRVGMGFGTCPTVLEPPVEQPESGNSPISLV
jgi:hypothetical protein